MITKIGIDLQLIDEVSSSLAEFGTRYSQRLYTQRELRECERSSEPVATALAKRFAAKEAVLKVLDPDDVIPSWLTIEIRSENRAIPEIFLSGEASELANRRGIVRMFLSCSQSLTSVIATVIADIKQRP